MTTKKVSKMSLEELQDEAGKEFNSTEEVETFIEELATARKENTMTFKGSIAKGDVPETDAEVEQEIAKIEKRSAKKAAKGGQAKNERQLKLVAPKTKVEKPAKVKKEKAPRVPLYLSGKKNPHGYAPLQPSLVIALFADVDKGMSRQDAATKYNVSLSSVSTIMAGPEWFKVGQSKKGLPIEDYPTRTPKAEKTSEKKAE